MSAVRRAWAWLPRPLRVAATGGIATAVDTAVLVALCWGAGVVPGLAALLGCLAGGALNFAINRRWIFRATDRSWIVQALAYGVIVVGGGAIVSGLAVAAGVAVGLPLLAAKVGAAGVSLVAWTYPISARVVFRCADARIAPPLLARARSCGHEPAIAAGVAGSSRGVASRAVMARRVLLPTSPSNP